MHTLPRFGWAVGIALVLALALTGCKKSTEPEVDTAPNPMRPDPAGGPPAASHEVRGAQLQVLRNLMHNLGVYYVGYSAEGRPPRTREEFKARLKEEGPDTRVLVQALDKDWLVLRLDPPPRGDQVLGYEKEPFKLRNDRLVLLGGGSVVGMGDEEFQKALKQ
jgi:hypothetical protein